MQRILAADIGGTNCRFASFSLENERLILDRVIWIKSAGLVDTDRVLAALARELETSLDTADAPHPRAGRAGKRWSARQADKRIAGSGFF